MAIAAYKTWIAGEVLTAADLNASFSQIIDNATALVSPFTGQVDLNGNELVLDADADTSVTSDTDDRVDFRAGGVDVFRIDGSTASSVNGFDVASSATGNPVRVLAQGSDSNIGISIVPKGSGSILLDASSAGTGVDIDGAALVLDADGDTSIRETADDVVTIRMQGVDVFVLDGDVASPVNGLTLRSSATTVRPEIAASGSDTDIGINLLPKGVGEVTVSGVEFFDVDYYQNAANQTITAATEADLTSLTGLNLPNTNAVNTRKFLIDFCVPVGDTSAAANLFQVRVYSGANGNISDGNEVYRSVGAIPANTPVHNISGHFRLAPSNSAHVKFGLAVFSVGNGAVGGTTPIVATLSIQEVPS